jgi:hypothetical protein
MGFYEIAGIISKTILPCNTIAVVKNMGPFLELERSVFFYHDNIV